MGPIINEEGIEEEEKKAWYDKDRRDIRVSKLVEKN